MEQKISQIFQNCKSQCVLFTNIKEIFYLTDAEFDGFWLLLVKDKIYSICSKMIEHQLREFFKNRNINICVGEPFYKTITEILKQNNVNNVLIDTKYIDVANFILLSEKLNQEKINIVKKAGILDNIRITKNKDEIIKLKKSCKIVSEVCNTIKGELKPGVSELDIHYRVLELFAKNHVVESFNPIIASGENSANPHHISSLRKITTNDIVMMDIGCVYKGYCSDLTRTYFLGRIDDDKKKIWDVVKNAQNAVIKGIRAGLPIAWADKTARNIIKESGYEDKFIHATGHGIGIEIHEMPSLASNAEGIFLTRMAVTVEPGIYIEQNFGVRIEDTILIKENDCEVLTSAVY
ncbi:MAG: M24 family metallopeptidase [Endomicrobium sp.]|uniref:M24 family metallopeptidase n=1 Tax=Candidatus Endomicrobiellum pyrsonymphae TaxID=1408203 RepID=UPI00357EC950|nr:M24 family metallopeptidase [Endomicrobium sp.]